VTIDVGDHYRRSRLRLVELITTDGAAVWSRPVPACPGWDVHAVVSHLVGVTEDALAGRLSGPPSDDVTAEQVDRHRNESPDVLLARWADLAGPFEAAITAGQIFPAVLDVLSHEHDVRGALGRPGAREIDTVVLGAERLVSGADLPGVLEVELDGRVVRSPDVDGPAHRLRTSAFEVVRLRLGRRSRDQVAALDWSPPPDGLLDALFAFGPRETALVE